MRRVLYLLIALFIFSTFFLSSFETSYADQDAFDKVVNPGVFHNNGNTEWEVAYRIWYTRHIDGRLENQNTNVYFKWSNLIRNCSRGEDWCNYDVNDGISFGLGAHGPFEMQWGTTCIDPKVDPYFSLTTGGTRVFLFRANVTSGRAGADNSGARISYAYGADIVGRTDACPFPCPNPDCSGRCGIVTNHCGYGVTNPADCGGCGGDICGTGNHQCDMMDRYCDNTVCREQVRENNNASCMAARNACVRDSNCGGNEYCKDPVPCGECTAYAHISGNVYIDKNRNGNWDGEPADQGLAGKSVSRRPAASSTWSDGTSTGGSGGYTFGGLRNPSDHDIRIIQSEYDDCALTLHSASPRTVTATDNNADFRFTEKQYVVWGTVYRDTNHNGLLEVGVDPPLLNRPSVQVRLIGSGLDNLNPDNGNFRFTDATVGTQTVNLVTSSLPDGFYVVGPSSQTVTVVCGNVGNVNFLVTRDVQPAPNLEITDFNIPNSPTAGVPASAFITVYNSGESSTGRNFNISVDNGAGNSYSVTLSALNGLTPKNVNVPIGTYPADGTYTATAVVDSGGAIVEADENDNTAYTSYIVGTVPNPDPDPDPTFSYYNISGQILEENWLTRNGVQDPGESFVTNMGTISLNGDTSGVSWTSDSFSIRNLFGGSGYSLTYRPPDLYQLTFPPISPASYNMTLGPGCSVIAPATCNSDNVFGVLFGIAKIPPKPWFQGIGGDMRADNFQISSSLGTTTSNIIPTSANSYLSYASGNQAYGLGFGKLNIVGGDIDTANANGRFVQKDFQGSKRVNYTDMNNAITRSGTTDKSKTECPAASPCSLSGNPSNTISYLNGNVNAGPALITITGKRIYMINGDLNINGDIKVAPGNVAIFIVKGNITVNNGADNIQGLYSTDNNFIVLADNQTLTIEGSVRAGLKLDSKRDLTNNDTTPSILFKFRPDFVLYAPSLLPFNNYKYREVLPGQ